MTNTVSTPRPGARGVLLIVLAGTLLMSLSSNMLNIAVPALSSHFLANSTETSILVMAYQLVNTALIIPAGQLADALERRWVFLTGIGVFTLTSILMGFAPSIEFLIVGRAIQGAAAAMLLSNSVAILAAVFPGRSLGGAMGIYMAGFSLGQVAGPLAGGVIVSAVGWRWLFWGLAPIALAAFLYGLSALKVVPAIRKPPRIDIPGGFVLGLIMIGSQLAFGLAADAGLGDPIVLAILAACIVAAVGLAWIEHRVRHPALDPTLFERLFSLVLAEGFLIAIGRLGAITITGLWLQGVHGDSAATAALKILTFPVALTLGTLLGDKIGQALGPRRTRVGAAGLTMVSTVVMLLATLQNSQVLAMIGLALMGVGTGIHQALHGAFVLWITPRDRTAVVNAIRVLAQTFSVSFGLAIAMALIVAFAPSDLAQVFLSGDADALGEAGRAMINSGYALTYAVYGVMTLIGVLISLWPPGDRHPAHD